LLKVTTTTYSTFNKLSETDGEGNTTHYHYDYAGRKILEEKSRKKTFYSYDSLGRLYKTQEGDALYEEAYNPKGELIEEKTKDLDGNLVEQEHYVYDELGNRTHTINSKGTTETYYNTHSLPILKKDPVGHVTQLSYEYKKRELYFYDGDNEIGSTDENGHIKELRLLGEGLGGEIGASILLELQGKTYIPLHDHRGCIVTLVNLATKKSTETYRYTAYGEQLTTGELSPWRFSSKRVDPETGLIYFGRRYYSPSLGRWTTPDPQGLQDGPNLYAYLHNCPLNDFDLYGLWSWMSMWEGTKSFGLGASGYLYDMGCGMGHGLGKMGQWMHADFQYEYFNDRSFFHTKSLTATEGWKSLGKAVWKDPIGTCVPGIMEAWRNPTSPAAWGKAAVDAALIGLPLAKFGRATSNFGKAGNIGEEFATFRKIEIASEKMFEIAPRINRGISVNRLNHIFSKSEHALESLVSKFGSQQHAFNAVQHAANQALKLGKLTPNVKGILPSGDLGNIINVGGMNVKLIGGRVENGRVIISSFSRKGL
jgi:RHS repeat-associated protein